MKRLALWLATAVACGTPAHPPAAPSTTRAPDAVIAPLFTGAQLRGAMAVGAELRLRITKAGAPTVIEHWRVTAADAAGCTIHTVVYGEDGVTVVEDQGPATATWQELASHGAFPAALTRVTDAAIEVPAGRFASWLVVVDPAVPGGAVRRMHFARDLPGPPVWMEVRQGDQLVLRLELLARTSAPEAPP